MNMHATDNLKHYPLPSRLALYLREVDAHAQRMAQHGESVDPEITLSEGDYALVDESVRTVSNGRFRASTVMWNGRPLRRHVVAVAA
jgi:hypothetical protein